jgi:hypothetical protein
MAVAADNREDTVEAAEAIKEEVEATTAVAVVVVIKVVEAVITVVMAATGTKAAVAGCLYVLCFVSLVHRSVDGVAL